MEAAESQPLRKKTADQVVIQNAPSALQRSRDKRKLLSKLELVEAKIAELEATITAIEARLSAPSSPDEAITDAKAYETSGQELEQLMCEWEQLGSQIDALG